MTATAASGINQQLNFQGRLLNAQGATVPDGYYNMELKIYQDGDGQSAADATGTPAGTLLWTEDHMNANSSQGITVINGYFSVQLGALCAFSGGSCQGNSNTGVNWNSDTLWLSMNVAGTNATCTPFSSCTPDGEMLPMKRLSANSYAFNSKLLGGLSSANFLQIAQGVQTDATNNTSVYLNKTGTGNLVDLQSSGADAFTVSNSGDLTFGANANHTLSVATGAAGAAGKTINLLGGAAGTGATALSGGDLVVAAGAGGGTNGSGGNVTIDAGAANGTGADGTISIGSTHASSIQIGNVTSASNQTIAIGNNNTAGSTDTVTVGNLNGTSTTTINGGSGNINLSTNQAGAGVVVKTLTNNSTTALQVQNASGYAELTVDTSGNKVTLGNVTSSSGQGVQGLLAFADGTADNFAASLSTNGAITANRSIYLPDESGTICLRNSSNCGFLSGSGGANFINNGTTVQNAANFYIRSNGNTVTGTLEAASGQTADILDLNTYNGTTSTNVAKFDSNGNLAFQQSSTVSTATGTLTVQAASTLALGNSISTSVSIQAASAGAVSLGTTNANTVAIGSTNTSTIVSLFGGGGINIGTGNVSNTVQVGNTANAIAQTINIGNNSTSGSTDTVNIGNLNGTSSTTIQAGSGNITLATNQAGAGTIVKTVSNNSSTAFQVQNSASGRVFGVDTSSNLVQLGQSSTLNGTLVFKNSSGSNAVTLNSTAANSNYTLTLPSAAPSTGLCIETSSGSASQLVFASCTNNNASIQEVNEWDSNNANTVTVSPSTIGDEIVLTTQIPTSGVTVTSVSGGDVSTWNKVVTSANNSSVHRVEMWVGTVSSLGSSTLTVTYSSSPGAEEVTATEFTAAGANASTSWGIESSAAQLNSTSSTTVTYPSATAVNGSELYVGYAQVQNPPGSAGNTSGFNYIVTSTQHNVITYNTDLSANTTYQPTANQNSSGESNTVEAVLTAFVTSTSINNATSLQKANYYVQAASAGSVAGVLQAASSGSADILDLRNSSAVNVATVGMTGIATFENSTDSASGFQVQNHSGTNILSVNTLTNSVNLGASATATGALNFFDNSDTNSITLAAPSSIAANYTLALPTNSPTGGLCLGTSPSNANQLIFASCATQVSAAGISYVTKWQSTGTGNTSVADSPVTKGDLLVLFSHTTGNATISGISGGGVSSWTKVTTYNAASGAQGNVEMWRGVVNVVGASTINVTYTGTVTASDVAVQEYTMGSSNGTWAIDTSGTANATSATTINYPTLTAQNSSELYTGYAWGANTMSAGTTSGFTYLTTAANKYLAYDLSVTGGVAYTPTASQATAGAYASIGAMIEAYAGTSVIVDTTATQEANFNVQAATAGTVAGVLQVASNSSADILQAKDSSGNNIFSVNGSVVNSQTGVVSGVTLGTAGTVAGQLNFAASGNTNTISLVAPSTPGASYSLTLPSTTPAPGQCLASSPNNASQLVFSSCANQVTSVAISLVTNWKSSTVTLNPTLNVSPTTLGDLMTLFIYSSKGNTVNSVSGGGVTTWSKIVGANSEEMWRGIVTSTGSSTISVTVSTPSSPTEELAAQEWTTGSTNGSWVIDASGTISNASSTTVSYPNLTPQSTKDLYIGYAIGTSTMSAGSTAGYSYFAGAGADIYGAYNTSVSAATQPTAYQSSAGTSIAAGALIAAYSSSSVIANSANTQEANFNVQAATSGSVAGVLQAAAGGNADVLDILNAAGTITDSFGSTGNLLIKPSSASASAFAVQTTGGVNVLSVDTSSNLAVVGAGATGETSPSLLVLDNEIGSSADPTELNGAMYYNATTHTFRCGVDGSWQSCTGLLYANTSNSAANNNCTSNCTAFSTSAAIPANYCQPGRVIKLFAAGYFSSVATPSNLQLGVYYGTDASTAANDTLLGTLPPAASVTSASNNYFQLNFNMICFSTSSVQSGGILNIQTGAASAGMSALPMSSTSGTTISSNTAKNLYVFPIWDNASTSNTATLTQFTVNTY
ncbi:MAG TPA: hypothetical protein VFN56_02155 [Candidatus Saccharimonadales bacterium]|nr:hypothetical protein [Candidatus Saccharimonadales bacterium]